MTFNDVFDIRLINGSSDLVGILELRHNESSWAPACFYDKSSVRVIPQNVCNDLGHNCAYKWQLVQPKESQGLEYVFHEGTNGWLGVENRCLRHGGSNLHIECSIGKKQVTDFVFVLLYKLSYAFTFPATLKTWSNKIETGASTNFHRLNVSREYTIYTGLFITQIKLSLKPLDTFGT